MKQSTFRILILLIFLVALLMGSAAMSTSASLVSVINKLQSGGSGGWMMGNDGVAPGNLALPGSPAPESTDIFESLGKFFDNVARPFLKGFTDK